MCYCNVLLQYSWVQGYCYVCVLLKCVVTVELGTGLMLCVCVCYCNVLLQYSWVQCYCYVCVTLMCCYSAVGYRVTVMCMCYCNVLLQYSWVQRYR